MFQTGVFPDLDSSFLFCPFLSFLGLSRFFRDFPDLLGDGPGIFPICPFPLSRPIKSTYEEQSRKGPRHNLYLSRKKWETPGFGNPPRLASLNFREVGPKPQNSLNKVAITFLPDLNLLGATGNPSCACVTPLVCTQQVACDFAGVQNLWLHIAYHWGTKRLPT